MKKILALVMAGTLFVALSVSAFATESTETEASTTGASTESTNTGSKSKTAEELLKEVEELKQKLDEQAAKAEEQAALQNEKIEEQQKHIDEQKDQIKTQAAQISALISAVQAAAKSNSNSGGSSGGSSGRTPTAPSSNDVRTQSLIRNNAVSYGGNIVAQGGHVEINGGKSNVTFLVGVPDGATMNSAYSLATNLGGSLINCVSVSSQVAFRSAKVNFYITGVNIGDNVAVYQVQGGKWVQLQTAEIRKDHVVVNMSQTGTVAFLRVPVLATATH